jgi:hypothetical protein
VERGIRIGLVKAGVLPREPFIDGTVSLFRRRNSQVKPGRSSWFNAAASKYSEPQILAILRQAEDEDRRLKKMFAELRMQNELL